MSRALEDVKVLDLTQFISGPYCTKLLADQGADVIKVEQPGIGDGARNMPPFFLDDPHPEKSIHYLYLNSNKRSITLNLRSDAGVAMLKKLAGWADVVVENYAPGVLDEWGLGYGDLKKTNPQLVMVSISNFGQTGPYRDYKATDLVNYALGGLMYIFGAYDREPLKHALSQAQYRAGTYAASATLIALHGQRMLGQGQHVDVSIQESIACALRDTTSQYTYWGAIRRRLPRVTGGMARVMACADGYILPIAYGGVEWEVLANFLEAPELNDPKFESAEGRTIHAEELQEVLDRAFRAKDKLSLFHGAHEWGISYGVVLTPKEVVESEQLAHRGYFSELAHPVAGTGIYPGSPFKMSETPIIEGTAAPTLGQHNKDIFSDILGYSRDELVKYRELGVI